MAQIGMGIGGASMAMGAYALTGGVTGNSTGAGFAGAAVGGFVYGAGGFNSVSLYAGALAGGATEIIASECARS